MAKATPVILPIPYPSSCDTLGPANETGAENPGIPRPFAKPVASAPGVRYGFADGA